MMAGVNFSFTVDQQFAEHSDQPCLDLNVYFQIPAAGSELHSATILLMSYSSLNDKEAARRVLVGQTRGCVLTCACVRALPETTVVTGT